MPVGPGADAARLEEELVQVEDEGVADQVAHGAGDLRGERQCADQVALVVEGDELEVGAGPGMGPPVAVGAHVSQQALALESRHLRCQGPDLASVEEGTHQAPAVAPESGDVILRKQSGHKASGRA